MVTRKKGRHRKRAAGLVASACLRPPLFRNVGGASQNVKRETWRHRHGWHGRSAARPVPASRFWQQQWRLAGSTGSTRASLHKEKPVCNLLKSSMATPFDKKCSHAQAPSKCGTAAVLPAVQDASFSNSPRVLTNWKTHVTLRIHKKRRRVGSLPKQIPQKRQKGFSKGLACVAGHRGSCRRCGGKPWPCQMRQSQIDSGS